MIEKELIYYNCLINRIKLLKNKIDEVEYNMTGVKGIDYEKPMSSGSSDPLLKRIRFIEQGDNLEKLKKMLSVEELHKDIIDSMLNKLDNEERNLIELRYFKELKYEDIAELTNYDISNVYRKIHNIIDKLEKM